MLHCCCEGMRPSSFDTVTIFSVEVISAMSPQTANIFYQYIFSFYFVEEGQNTALGMRDNLYKFPQNSHSPNTLVLLISGLFPCRS